VVGEFESRVKSEFLEYVVHVTFDRVDGSVSDEAKTCAGAKPNVMQATASTCRMFIVILLLRRRDSEYAALRRSFEIKENCGAQCERIGLPISDFTRDVFKLVVEEDVPKFSG